MTWFGAPWGEESKAPVARRRVIISGLCIFARQTKQKTPASLEKTLTMCWWRMALPGWRAHFLELFPPLQRHRSESGWIYDRTNWPHSCNLKIHGVTARQVPRYEILKGLHKAIVRQTDDCWVVSIFVEAIRGSEVYYSASKLYLELGRRTLRIKYASSSTWDWFNQIVSCRYSAWQLPSRNLERKISHAPKYGASTSLPCSFLIKWRCLY
jgi:hypothetical protein